MVNPHPPFLLKFSPPPPPETWHVLKPPFFKISHPPMGKGGKVPTIKYNLTTTKSILCLNIYKKHLPEVYLSHFAVPKNAKVTFLEPLINYSKKTENIFCVTLRLGNKIHSLNCFAKLFNHCNILWYNASTECINCRVTGFHIATLQR